MIKSLPPLSLYIHIPWCVKKCPYCDFNSHKPTGALPIEEYVQALTKDLTIDACLAQGRKIHSIFFGGGTPSLFPGSAIKRILETVDDLVGIENGAEITLEANPGTAEYDKFSHYIDAGVNRLSMGVQSFNDRHLQQLGRIHDGQNAINAFQLALQAGFDNINLDLIHGLESQTSDDALSDIQQAIDLGPTHLSWYQLTIEPNTAFYSNPPTLPVEDVLHDIQDAGHSLLQTNGYTQYEVSAYSKPEKQSIHNLNYWSFGDYLAIGAGAHGKVTQLGENAIIRFNKTRLPQDYLGKSEGFKAKQTTLQSDDLPLEFMMNAMRLCNGVSTQLFEERTGLTFAVIEQKISRLKNMQLLKDTEEQIEPTEQGQKFLNNMLELFM